MTAYIGMNDCKCRKCTTNLTIHRRVSNIEQIAALVARYEGDTRNMRLNVIRPAFG